MYLRTFVNWKQDNWAKLLLITEFAYNNAKNASISHTPFKLNCDYHLRVSLEKEVDSHSRSCSTNKLVKKLKKLIKVCC